MQFFVLFGALLIASGSLAVPDNEKANIEDFFSNNVPESEIIEKCKGLSNVSLTKSTDIICLLGAGEIQPSRDVKCLIECVANLQNITRYGILDPVSIMNTLQKKYSNENPLMMNAVSLTTFCSVQTILPFGLHQKVIRPGYPKFDGCHAAYGGLKCLQLPGITDTFIHLYNCSNYN